jgi:hypothetical protein
MSLAKREVEWITLVERLREITEKLRKTKMACARHEWHNGVCSRCGVAWDKIPAPSQIFIRMERDDLDLTIGRLDRVLSLLILVAKDPHTDYADRQTLKHHAEDMVAAGQKIIELLGHVGGTPQPS